MHTKNVLYAKLQIPFIGMFVITQILLLCRTSVITAPQLWEQCWLENLSKMDVYKSVVAFGLNLLTERSLDRKQKWLPWIVNSNPPSSNVKTLFALGITEHKQKRNSLFGYVSSKHIESQPHIASASLSVNGGGISAQASVSLTIVIAHFHWLRARERLT